MNLEAKNLVIGYGRQAPVFTTISFSAGAGDMVALLGVNGIGKSTLLRTLVGLQRPLNGQVRIGEKSLSDFSVGERSRLVSVVLTEKLWVDNITVRELVALGRSPYTDSMGRLSEEDNRQVELVLGEMKLYDIQHKVFNELSDGLRQKVLIARALCQQTEVIVLDEPTAFLDFRNKREILALLSGFCRQFGKIIILSTHDIETALDYCNKCWIMTENKQFIEVNGSNNIQARVKAILFNEATTGAVNRDDMDQPR